MCLNCIPSNRFPITFHIESSFTPFSGGGYNYSCNRRKFSLPAGVVLTTSPYNNILGSSLPKSFFTKKQINAFMPNVIHSLDATSLSLLYNSFSKEFFSVQFYSVHDCFVTTCDKVFVLKTILASVYTDASEAYLYKFNKGIFDQIENSTDYTVHHIKRAVVLDKGKYRQNEIY